MANTAELTEGSPPYMHTRYLDATQQKYCMENPSYQAGLRRLGASRQDVQYAQIALDVRRRTDTLKDQEARKALFDLRDLENQFMALDNELAELAETLLHQPQFDHTDELLRLDSRWLWPIPVPFTAAAGCRSRASSEHFAQA
jgi:hypothetical protein